MRVPWAATAQRVHFRTIGLMLFDRGHARMCLCWVSVFRRLTVFKLYTDPQSSPKLPKNQFLTPKRKNFKLSLRKDPFGHWFAYSCQVSRKSVKRKWPNGSVVFIKKKIRTLPLSLGLLKRSRQTFYRITLSPLSISLPSFVQICPVFDEILYPKLFSRLTTASAWSRGANKKNDLIFRLSFISHICQDVRQFLLWHFL